MSSSKNISTLFRTKGQRHAKMGNYSTTVHGLYLLITVQWTYNLGQNKMEQITLSPPPPPQSNDEGRKEQKRAILGIIEMGERGGPGVHLFCPRL